MPYDSNSALPPSVRSRYSSHCQGVFRRVFNENYGGGEGKAFRIAHTAARRCMEAKSMSATDHNLVGSQSDQRSPLPNAQFTIFSGLLKSIESDGVKRIRTVASSTLTDHKGDQITKRALDQMAASAEGMTVFLNHKHSVPEDVFGVVKTAKTIQRGEVWDLDFEIEVDDNPRAATTVKQIERGVKLGTSIGALVKDAWREDGILKIDDVVLAEASIVGIPANPRTWVQYATKSLIEAESEEDEDEDEGAKRDIDHTSSNDTLDEATVEPTAVANFTVNSTSTTPNVSFTMTDSTGTVTKERPSGEDAESTEPASEPEAEVAQEGQPTTEPDSDQDETPDTADKGISLEEVDAGDPVGDAARALHLKQSDLTTLLRMVETSTAELVTTKKALFDEQQKVVALERERDEAKSNVELAKQFVAKLAELPLGRRASHAAVISDFRERLGGVYDPDFLKMLTTGETNARE